MTCKRIATCLATTTALCLGLALIASSADAAEVVLSGSIKSAAGEKMEGVTVSAKAEGSHHHHHGLHRRKRRLLFSAARGRQIQGLGAGAELRDRQERCRPRRQEEPGFRAGARSPISRRGCGSCPAISFSRACRKRRNDDKRMKRIFRNNCTSCHTPSYTLQHRFDENGWHAIVQAMKTINVYGMYRPDTPANPVLDFHQKELAGYLATRARTEPGWLQDHQPAAPHR